MISLGIYVTSQLLQVNKYRGEFREKFKPQYTVVMRTTSMPQTMKMAVSKLDRLQRRIKAQSTGVGGEIPAKVTSLLKAFNQGKLAEKTKLQIDSITVSSRSIMLTGDTSNRSGTLKLREAIKQAKLGSVTERLELAKTGRDSFRMTVTAAK
jgi:hypothetical protein